MRRVAPGKYVDLPPFHLYLDDLIEIEQAFRATGTLDLEIKADDYAFDHAEAMSGLGASEVSALEIHSDLPYVTLEVRPYLARFYVSDTDDLRQIGLLGKIREIVAKRGHRAGRKRRWVVSLTRSTAPPPPTWRERNRDITVALIGAIGGAVAAGVVTLLLIAAGVLKT